MEGLSASPRARRQALLAAAVALLALVAAGCGALGYSSGSGNKQNGKTLFQQKCGSCHTLADAGTSGTVGPNLDDAFREALKTGMSEATVRQVVRGQIAFAIDNTSTGAPGMPKNLVKGRDAEDVAAYVASAAVKDVPLGPGGQGAAPAPATTTTPTTTTPAPSGGTGGGTAGDAAAGKKVFVDAGGCGACHTLKDAGTTGTVGPDLDKLKADAEKAGKPLDAYVMESVVDPNAYVVPGFSAGVMPPDFKTTLSSKQIDDVVAYVVGAAG